VTECLSTKPGQEVAKLCEYDAKFEHAQKHNVNLQAMSKSITYLKHHKCNMHAFSQSAYHATYSTATTHAKVASTTPRSLASSRTGGTPTECLTAEHKNQLNTKRNLDTDIVILFAHPHQFRFTQC
jgi:hypothetical protein